MRKRTSWMPSLQCWPKACFRVKGLSEEVMHNRLFNWLLLTEREVCMGESWLRSPLLTERSEGCISDWGQDSPIQTDLALLIRCLIYGQTRKQRNKNINFDFMFAHSFLGMTQINFANICLFSLPASSWRSTDSSIWYY